MAEAQTAEDKEKKQKTKQGSVTYNKYIVRTDKLVSWDIYYIYYNFQI